MSVLLSLNSPCSSCIAHFDEGYSNLCQYKAYKEAGGATKNPIASEFALEMIYFSIIADIFEKHPCCWSCF